jgi:hypothetical protein
MRGRFEKKTPLEIGKEPAGATVRTTSPGRFGKSHEPVSLVLFSPLLPYLQTSPDAGVASLGQIHRSLAERDAELRFIREIADCVLVQAASIV